MAAHVEVDLQFPPVAASLFRKSRYKCMYGGRGSSKSWSAARALILLAAESKVRVLCTREFQNSIAESVHKLLSDQIRAMKMQHKFEIQQQAITGANGSEFIFLGIASNTEKLKSCEGIDIAWCEEAEHISERSWEILIPTIRQPGSEIWVTFNPDEESDPTYQRFVVNQPPDCISVLVNWHDNPWFPDELRREKDYLYRVDAESADHVWGGQCRRNASAQIFRNKYVVEAFEPPSDAEYNSGRARWDGPYFGADWGFSNDPTVLVKCWLNGRRLMVEHEAWGVGVELDAIPALFERVPDARNNIIRADCSRPETISHIAGKGFRVEACEKWSGSVEDGIAFLRSFEQIVVHPRCQHTIEEMRLYSYKRDRLTGEVRTEIVGRFDHCCDSIRYALGPLITNQSNLATWMRAFDVSEKSALLS